LESGRLGPKETKPSTNGDFMVRELHDPFVKFNELTSGSLDFSKVQRSESDVGIVFLSLSGLALMIIILFGLYFVLVIVRLSVMKANGGNGAGSRQPGDAMDLPTTGLLSQQGVDEPEDEPSQIHPLEFGN
jgi:hypothetical protein